MARRKIALLLLALVLLAACQGKVSTVEPTPTSLTQVGEVAEQHTPNLPTLTPTEALPTHTPTRVEASPTEPPPTLTSSPTPSDTPPPTPTLTPSQTPTPTVNATATVEAAQIRATEVAQAVEGTLAVLPTVTPYPTYTRVPSDTPRPTETPSLTPSPTQTATLDVMGTVEAARIRYTEVAQMVAETLAAVPSQTPYPTYTLIPSATPTPIPPPSATPTIDVMATVEAARIEYTEVAQAVEETLMALPTATPYPTPQPQPTYTPYPTYTLPPSPSATPLQPTITATPFNTATAHAQSQATATALAQMLLPMCPTCTPPPSRTPVPTYTLYPTYTAYPTYTPYPTYTVTPSMTPLPTLEINFITVTPISPILPSPTADLLATATALVQQATEAGQVEATSTYSPILFTATVMAARQTATAAAPTPTPILPTPTPLSASPTPVLVLPGTPTPTPDLLLTATARVQMATLTAQPRPTNTLNPFALTATASAQQLFTPLPAVPTHTPTRTPTPTIFYGATATQIVMNATATAQILQTPISRFESAALRIAFDVPEGWRAPAVITANRLYLTDGRAEISIYRGDARYFEQTWGIPADTRDLDEAAAALAEAVNGAVERSNIEGAALVNPAGGRGALYLLALDDGGWVIVSASAPEDDFETIRAQAVEPLVRSLRAVEPTPTVTPTPTRAPRLTGTPTPASPAVSTELAPYENEDMALAFDAPADWTPTVFADLVVPELGVSNVLFYADPDDINRDEPSAPTIVVLRLNRSGGVIRATDPVGVLDEFFDLTRDQVESYDLAAYPAARAVVTDGTAVYYALTLPNLDTILAALFAPEGYNLARLDEAVMQPLIQSLRATDQVEAEPTLTPLPTYTPWPTYTPNPTYTPLP